MVIFADIGIGNGIHQIICSIQQRLISDLLRQNLIFIDQADSFSDQLQTGAGIRCTVISRVQQHGVAGFIGIDICSGEWILIEGIQCPAYKAGHVICLCIEHGPDRLGRIAVSE